MPPAGLYLLYILDKQNHEISETMIKNKLKNNKIILYT